MRIPAPFLWTAVIWAVFSLGLIGILAKAPLLPLIMLFLKVGLACFLDFVALAGMCHAVLQPQVNPMKAALWGSSKLLGFALVGLALMTSKGQPIMPVLLGAATMMVIPLGGAIGWLKKEFD